MTTLYKKDSKGNIRILNYWTEGADFCQSSGLEDGKLVENRKTCKGKNIGKTNETTPAEQAILEMESKVREKLQEDYFNTKEEAESNEVLLPMLAKSYKDYKDKVDYDFLVHIQPKLDGMRCLAVIKNGKINLFSRDGIDIISKWDSMHHIIEDLKLFKEDIVLDGELYCHGDTFQEVMKKIKKYRKGESEEVSYHIYDIVSNDNFKNRYDKLISLFHSNIERPETTSLQLVRTIGTVSEDSIPKCHQLFLKEGYEGSMVRWGKEGYKINGRSECLLKNKDFQDLDALILDIVPAENRPDWGVVVCEYNGKQFRATPKMPHDDKIELLKNKEDYIGKKAVITYFEFTDDGVPRFPIYKGTRLDNDKGS